MKRQIIAIGGGGFSGEESSLLHRYILKASGKTNPKICFVATASGETEGYVLNFYRALPDMNVSLAIYRYSEET